jgi:osmoprotectant transport system ATP-binding protein
VKDFIGEKRLETNKKLPQLDRFICKDFISISDDSTKELAMDRMIAHQASDIPVVKKDGSYVGLISLYDVLTHKDKKLTELLTQFNASITENEETESVLNNMKELQGTVPVITADQTLIGILDKNKLFQELQDVTEMKSGVV